MKTAIQTIQPEVEIKELTCSAPVRRSISDLLAPVERLAAESPNLIVRRQARFDVGGESYFIPRIDFIGPKSGDTPTRLGIFAGIHGDEPESVHAAIRFIRFLEHYPELAAGYCLSFYPLCNPTGFEDNTRHSRRGKDLNREFWSNSAEPEVLLLEKELDLGAFDGIVSLHIDDTSDGFYGIVGGATLTRNLIAPALKAADQFLPLDKRAQIDGFPALDSVLREPYAGVLRARPGIRLRPFEITLEAPQQSPAYLIEWSFVAALEAILSQYRAFIAYARNV